MTMACSLPAFAYNQLSASESKIFQAVLKDGAQEHIWASRTDCITQIATSSALLNKWKACSFFFLQKTDDFII